MGGGGRRGALWDLGGEKGQTLSARGTPIAGPIPPPLRRRRAVAAAAGRLLAGDDEQTQKREPFLHELTDARPTAQTNPKSIHYTRTTSKIIRQGFRCGRQEATPRGEGENTTAGPFRECAVQAAVWPHQKKEDGREPGATAQKSASRVKTLSALSPVTPAFWYSPTRFSKKLVLPCMEIISIQSNGLAEPYVLS